MVADFGTFRRGDVVRRAATPAQAVTLRAKGWKQDTAPVPEVPPEPPVPAAGTDLNLDSESTQEVLS